MTITAIAPGRVNLIGDHTDYTGGLVLPMAIHLATTIIGEPGGTTVRLSSADEPVEAVVDLDVADPTTIEPEWARYVAGVVRALRPGTGFTGKVSTTIPIGAGLSSSAAFEVALALALGFAGTPLQLAQLCQQAENQATGVPTGIMDQLASAAGRQGSALLIDCHALTVDPVALPDDVDIVVIHSGQPRTLAGSGYAERAAQCATAESIVGPLRLIDDVGALLGIDDPVIRRRAAHVVTENGRVRQFVRALSDGDRVRCGQLMVASHASLRDQFEVSVPMVDQLVDGLVATPGVLGARMTGGGFGGCVVAMTEPGVLEGRGWHVRPAAGAHVLS